MDEMFQTQLNLIEAPTQRIRSMTTTAGSPTIPSDSMHRSMTNILHDPQSSVTFESWFKRYKDMFTIDLAD